MSTVGGRYHEDPNRDGPMSTPWYVWVVLVAVTIFGLWLAVSSDGPMDPDSPLPTAPSVIMPVNSWS